MPVRMLLRTLGVAVLLLVAAGTAGADDEQLMSVSEAHDKAVSGEVILVDIRSPEEWRQTGIGEGAHAVSMEQPGFLKQIETLTDGDKSKAIAVICASGDRSLVVSQELAERGYSHVSDVAEGMLGSFFGPGWLATHLPTVPYAK